VARRKLIIYSAVLLLVVGGYTGYEAYETRQQEKRNQVLEDLINGSNCDACAARKKGIAKKKQERDQQFLIDQLNNEPVIQAQ